MVRLRPHYKLADVLAAVRAERCWIARTTATNHVKARLSFSSVKEANDFIRDAVQTLKPSDFVEAIVLDSGEPADVYGLSLDGDGDWYVKFKFERSSDGGFCAVVSFHPPKYPLTTVSKKSLKPW